MANFNKVILAGNLTRDPELRHTPKGTAVGESAPLYAVIWVVYFAFCAAVTTRSSTGRPSGRRISASRRETAP